MTSPSPTPRRTASLVWYRLFDLRVHDHLPLTLAHRPLPELSKLWTTLNKRRQLFRICDPRKSGFSSAHLEPLTGDNESEDLVLPESVVEACVSGGDCDTVVHVSHVCVVDESTLTGRSEVGGFAKLGVHRARFLAQAIGDLGERLGELGGRLIVRRGNPADVLAGLARQLLDSPEVHEVRVFGHGHVCAEEVAQERQVALALEQLGGRATLGLVPYGGLLLEENDLPFKVQAEEWPSVYTQFRKAVEKHSLVREPLPTPDARVVRAHAELPTGVSAAFHAGSLPGELIDATATVEQDPRSAFPFSGGESAALKHMGDYLASGRASTYKETRNGMVGHEYSSKLSPWLAAGCISARQVFYMLRAYERSSGANTSTYWLVFELLWRDFFHFASRVYGSSIFQLGGPKAAGFISGGDGTDKEWKHDSELLTRWVEGRTGKAFVDANMRELALTGFMSNRGRQVVASYLVNDLHLDWRLGAEYFESQLIDHDPCSNYGNWNYVAGVGCDPRQARYFNVSKQASRYDPQGRFRRLWLGTDSGLPDAPKKPRLGEALKNKRKRRGRHRKRKQSS